MDRVISYLSAAIIAFIVGLTAHSGVDTLGGFAVEKFCDVAPLAELKTASLLPESESIPARAHSCGHLVVSVADDGSLYLMIEVIKEAGADPIALVADRQILCVVLVRTGSDPVSTESIQPGRYRSRF